MASMRGFSVTTWIIIVCAAVYIIDGLMIPTGAALQKPGSWTLVTKQAVLDAKGEHPRLDGRTLRFDPPLTQAPAWNPVGRGPAPMLEGRRMVYDGDQLVYTLVYQNMPLLKRLGYFSTARALVGFTPSGNLMGGEFWRFITFQFLHGDFWHLLVNMFGLWIFGPLVERTLGGKRFLAFYLLCGIFGALLYLLLNAGGAALTLFGATAPVVLFNDTQVPLIGASAGVFGVLLAGAYLSPNTMVLLFFVIPIRLVTLAYGLVAVAVLTLLFRNDELGSNAGGEAAHLGGAIAGYYFIRKQHHLHGFFDFMGRVDPTSRSAKARRGQRRSGREAVADARRDAEIDRILAKIHEKGLQSLNAREKRLLRDSSKR